MSAEINDQSESALSRRGFLKACAGVAGLVLLGGPELALAKQHKQHKQHKVVRKGANERKLSFYNLHTGESLRSTYWANGLYVKDSLHDINHVLRDFRTGEIKPISPHLLDLLHDLQGRLGVAAAFHVISGYRSPHTNEMLSELSDGVARHSLHMEGEAIDIRLPGRPLNRVRKAALGMQRGGVGYYPKSDFVHVDVGRVRWWVG